MSKELDVPAKALREKASGELLRVWVTPDEATHVMLDLNPVSDPAVWGLVLADLAQRVANIYHIEKGADRQATIERIAAGFKAEIESPTASPASPRSDAKPN